MGQLQAKKCQVRGVPLGEESQWLSLATWGRLDSYTDSKCCLIWTSEDSTVLSSLMASRQYSLYVSTQPELR